MSQAKNMCVEIVPPVKECTADNGATQSLGSLSAKLALPWQGYILARPRLYNLVQRLRHGGIVAIVAGPGFGKTALIGDLLRRHQGPSAYYTLDESDTEPRVLLHGLFSAIGLIDVAAGTRGLEWLSSARPYPTNLEDLVVSLASSLPSREQGHGADCATMPFLAIDAVQHLPPNSYSAKCLRLFVEALPPGWLCALLSQTPLGLDTTQLQAQSRLVSIDHRTLRLTPVEVRAWAQEAWGIELSLPDARAIWRLTEGWPVALVLMGEQMRRAGRLVDRNWVMALLRKGTGLTRYLEEKVFVSLEPAAAEVFMTAWPLPRVEFPRDEELLPPGSEIVLEDLAQRGFLVTKTGGRTFTLHPLARAFSEKELSRRHPEAVRAARTRTAVHLSKFGRYREAASLHLLNEDLEAAAGPLRELAMNTLNASTPYPEYEWLDLLPETLISNEPWLLTVRARLLQDRGHYEEARALYRTAQQFFSRESEKEGSLQAALGEALCLYVIGRWQESLDVLSRAERLASSPSQRVEVLCNMASVLMALCRWDEAVERLELASAQLPADKRRAMEGRLNIYRARLFFLRGQYRLAAHWAARGVKASNRVGQEMFATALNASATILAQLGEYNQALLQGEAALALVIARRWAFMEAPVHLCLAEVKLGLEMRREGLAHAKRALEASRRHGDVEAEVWAWNLLGDICRQTGSPVKALRHHEKALELASAGSLSSYETARALCAIGIDQAVLGRSDEATNALREAASLARAKGLGAILSASRLYEGWLLALEGQERAAYSALTEFGRLAAEGGHLHFLLQEAGVALPIFALCHRFETAAFVREAIVPRLSTRQQRRYLDMAEGPTYPTDVPLGLLHRHRPQPRPAKKGSTGAIQPEEEQLAARVAQLTNRELEILKLIGLGLPNKVIAARLFIAEKTVKTHTNRMFRKLEVTNRLQAVLAFQAYQRYQASSSPPRERPSISSQK